MTLKLAVTVPVSPSVTVTSPIATEGSESSSVIVPSPCASSIDAFKALDRLRKKFSSFSSSASPLTSTVTVFVVSPAAKLSVPAVAW